jgi:hypothetical protein
MSVNNTHDLLITTIDLTRACCANGNYLPWLSRHGKALNGSAGIANYLANAALAFDGEARGFKNARIGSRFRLESLRAILPLSAGAAFPRY